MTTLLDRVFLVGSFLHGSQQLTVCQDLLVSQKGGSQLAPRFRTLRSQTLRGQLFKYANTPPSGKCWVIGVSICSLCAKPSRDHWLRTVSSFAIILWDS